MYAPGQSGRHEGKLSKFHQLGPVAELAQEAVDQLRPLAEEALLQGGEPFLAQRPQQPLLAEEGVFAEQAAQGCVLGHHLRCWRKDLDQKYKNEKNDVRKSPEKSQD